MAGRTDFVLDRDGVHVIFEDAWQDVRRLQDKLHVGSPLRPDAAERTPAIFDLNRWRIEVLPNLGRNGHVRVSGSHKFQKGKASKTILLMHLSLIL